VSVTFKSLLIALHLLGAPKDVAPEAATAIAKYARSDTEAAFMVAWADAESEFQRRIIDGRCHRWECDHGRAVGAWQMHRGAAGKTWDTMAGNLDAQAEAAARITRFALAACHAKGDAQVLGAFRVLGGLGCDRPLKGEAKRLAAFKRARGAL
jgi:hypothetical protein